MTQYLGGNEMLNTKDNEFNRVAISTIWHERPMLCSDQINVVGNVKKLSHYCCISSRLSVQFSCYVT